MTRMVRAVSTEELEKVMAEVESLITKGNVGRGTAQKEIKMRLSWCLEQLNAKLNENRILTKNVENIGDKKRIQSLESELTSIKREVVELKEKLLELNKDRASDLKNAMTELDRISFKRFDVFDRKERMELQKIYESFKDATRRGDDGAMNLMELIKKVESISKSKNEDDRSAMNAIERTTLPMIVDVYSGLFPIPDEEEEKAEPAQPASILGKLVPSLVKESESSKDDPETSTDPKESSENEKISETPKTPETSKAEDKASTEDAIGASGSDEATIKGTEDKTKPEGDIGDKPDDVTGAVGASVDPASKTPSPRPIVRRSTKDVTVPEVPKSRLPRFPSETPAVPKTGEGGGGGDDGSDDDDRSEDDEPEGRNGIFVVFGILLILVAIVIFLPEDKTEGLKALLPEQIRNAIFKTKESKSEPDKKAKKKR